MVYNQLAIPNNASTVNHKQYDTSLNELYYPYIYQENLEVKLPSTWTVNIHNWLNDIGFFSLTKM